MELRNMLKKGYQLHQERKRIKSAVAQAPQIANMPSYYPEKRIKSYDTKLKENIEWAKKYGEANEYYTLYGLDVEGSDASEYVDYYSFMVSRNKKNQIEKWGGSQTVLLRDKFLFYKYMQSNGMPVPEVFAIMIEGRIFDTKFNEIEVCRIENEKDYFVKDIDGECASFVKHINTFDDFLTIKERVSSGSFILQRRIFQSKEMSRLNPTAINTLRIVTINKNGTPYVLTALLRVGTSKTGSVDNWAAGGLAIGIEENGYLKEYGYYKPVHGLKADVHPDTKIKFSEYKVPMLNEALKAACEAHKAFYGLRAIGWDVAISEDGPIFVEGNDNFEITLQQVCDRPLKIAWIDAIQ